MVEATNSPVMVEATNSPVQTKSLLWLINYKDSYQGKIPFEEQEIEEPYCSLHTALTNALCNNNYAFVVQPEHRVFTYATRPTPAAAKTLTQAGHVAPRFWVPCGAVKRGRGGKGCFVYKRVNYNELLVKDACIVHLEFKKLYSVDSGIDLSSCRICSSVVDQHYCKNLFSNAGRELLNQVQEIHGAVLTKDKALPSLACRPCERKVKNAWNIKQRIAQTQDSYEKKTRAKRCINISPSSGQPLQKTRHIAATPARRSLGYDTPLVSLFFYFI